MTTNERKDWRAMMIEEKLWDYSLKSVPVPPVREMVEEIERLRAALECADRLAHSFQRIEAPELFDAYWAARGGSDACVVCSPPAPPAETPAQQFECIHEIGVCMRPIASAPQVETSGERNGVDDAGRVSAVVGGAGDRLVVDKPLAKACYVASEKHLSGYRLLVGFETLDAVQAAHEYVARSGISGEPR